MYLPYPLHSPLGKLALGVCRSVCIFTLSTLLISKIGFRSAVWMCSSCRIMYPLPLEAGFGLGFVGVYASTFPFGKWQLPMYHKNMTRVFFIQIVK